MQLTKTDFLRYLHCDKSLWILKREPASFPRAEFGAFEQKLAREGYQVENWFQALLSGSAAGEIAFQQVFETASGLHARLDGLETTPDGRTVLYEVKSSTSVKDDHIQDACFQKICAERAGQRIDRTVLVHLNPDYVRDGPIDPDRLLVRADVTDLVSTAAPAVEAAIDGALELLVSPTIDRTGCSCLYQSAANRCETFELFNPGIPSPSIYDLPRLSRARRRDLVDRGIFGLDRLPADAGLSEAQERVILSARTGAPVVDREAIRQFLAGLEHPLHFLDYETFASAVPILDGVGPHRHFPVQYSLHILDAAGTLLHREYLEREPRLPERLLEHMEADLGPIGSVVSWHAAFEKSRNTEMAAMFPARAAFLEEVNRRMVDIEEVFKAAYVDVRFGGSTSIKKVLPVICPSLGYKDLEVGDGATAMEAWERMLQAAPAQAERIAENLLRYCERDTFAMVEILRFLIEVAKS